MSLPPPDSLADRSHRVRELAREVGFEAVGIARVESRPLEDDGRRFREWLALGRHGSMAYLAREPERRIDPLQVLPGACSILCVALNYGPPETSDRARSPAETGRVAGYARGRDYHKVFSRRLVALVQRLEAEFPGVATRPYVDTGPVLEKLWAERAGLGWRGKHTNLVSRTWGSWLLLGEVILDLELEPDAPEQDHCGSCTRCLEACPTAAFPAPYQLDATRCISYLTIEHRGPIPMELRPLLGDRVFGCDDCLDVCPWNRFAREAREADFRPRPEVLAPLLADLVGMDETEFLRRFAGTALMRAKREGLARNACVALGNVGGPEALPALLRAEGDPSPLVREHAGWALARLKDRGVHRSEPEFDSGGPVTPPTRG